MTDVPAPGRSGPDRTVLAGWICLLLWWAVSAWLPLLGTVFGAPLGIAAFVLGIVAATRGQVLAGVLLVVLASSSGLISCLAGCAGLAGYGAMAT